MAEHLSKTVTEWAVLYPGDPEPRVAQPGEDAEWTVRKWVEHWNAHDAETVGEAKVMSRQVTYGQWVDTTSRLVT